MAILNYLLCILALAVLVCETWLILKRNGKIDLKGKDDFFTLCLVMLFVMLLLRPDADADLIVSLRNMLILAAVFFSIAVKRGISSRGVEKLGFVIPWEKIRSIHVAPYQMSKVLVVYTTDRHQYKLLFSRHQLKKLIYEMQKYYPDILIEESLKIS